MRKLLGFALLALPTPALAQADHAHMHGIDHVEEASGSPTEQSPDLHAGHDMNPMASRDKAPAAAPAPASAQVQIEVSGAEAAPSPPTDHAADAIFDSAEMAEARKTLQRENGGMPRSLILFDLAELQVGQGRTGFRWDGEARFGGDISQLKLKFEGETSGKGEPGEIEVQALYSRAISPYWDIQIGLRHDIKPDPSRTYLALGIEGLAPYWFELAATAFVSNKGDVHARLKGQYDQRITQRLILQPEIEANFAFQDVPELGIGSGLSTVEAGLRLRYELKREFAPYLGIEWRAKAGETARFARSVGEDVSTFKFVAGIRVWF